MTKYFVNDREFRVVGMSRSGNHAIINWIISQLEGRFCFLNCAEPKTNPFVSARPLSHGQCHVANYDEFDLEAEQQGRFSRKGYLVHSYEDCFLGMLSNSTFDSHHDRWLGSSRERVDILVLRDPFNLFASRRKAGFGGVTDSTAQRIWKQHAREFLGMRRYLGDNKLCISYNAWVNDKSYRRELARDLGLRFTDAGYRSVSYFAPGSSFDLRSYARRAHEMRVLQRWRHFADDPDYRRLFKGEIVQLANRIFGSDSDIEQALLSAS